MDFAFSEEQEMFRSMFRDFAAKEVAPKAEELDHEEQPPLDALRKAAQQGFLGATLPEAYFGAELDYLSYGMLIETLAEASVSMAVSLASHVSLVAMSILAAGTDTQKEEWLPQMAAGEALGAFALTEPDAGGDALSPGALRTRATLDGDDVILDGVKCWVTNGEIAGLFLVFAQGAEGVDAFLVPQGAPGLTVSYREPTLGLRSVPFNTLYLEGCRVPQANRLGDAGDGRAVARAARDRMAVALAAAGVGVSKSSVDAAAQFASERVQFDVVIAQKQAIQEYVAQAHAQVEALRALTYRVAWMVDQGEPFSVDAAVAKVQAARVARAVTNQMLQVLGGYGFMEDYPMARKYRDARALGLIGGPTEVHEFRIARQVFAGFDVEIVP